MASTDARPLPLNATALRIYFPLRLTTGALNSGAAGLDSEISLDGAAFSDCTNEATEIGSTGIYYLDLTSAELTSDCSVVQIKSSTTNAQTQVVVLYPVAGGDIPVNVTYYGGSAGAFASGFPQVNVVRFNGTAVTSSAGRPEVNTTHIAGNAVSTSTAQIGVNAVQAGGTAWGSGAITAASIASDAITAAKIATGAIDADAIAADAVDKIIDEVVEGSLTLRQVVRIMLAALAGKITDADTSTNSFRDVADTKDRIVATVDATGRTTITLDGS